MRVHLIPMLLLVLLIHRVAGVVLQVKALVYVLLVMHQVQVTIPVQLKLVDGDLVAMLPHGIIPYQHLQVRLNLS